MSEKIEENKNNIEEDSKKEIPKKIVKKTSTAKNKAKEVEEKPKMVKKTNSTSKSSTTKKTKIAKKEVEDEKVPTKKTGTTAKKSASSKKTTTAKKAPSKTSTTKKAEITRKTTTTKKNTKTATKITQKVQKEDSKINKLIQEQLENVERIEEIDKIQEKRKNKKKQAESRKVTIDKEKISKEIENAQKMPKEEKRKIRKKTLKNILIGLAIIIYYIVIGAGFYNIEETTYIVDLKVFSLLMLAITIILFENAYNKDNDEKAIIGIEFLSISIITLILIYAYILYKDMFVIVIGICLSVTLIYYLIKSITIYVKEKIKWKKTISDVKKIVSEG